MGIAGDYFGCGFWRGTITPARLKGRMGSSVGSLRVGLRYTTYRQPERSDGRTIHRPTFKPPADLAMYESTVNVSRGSSNPALIGLALVSRLTGRTSWQTKTHRLVSWGQVHLF